MAVCFTVTVDHLVCPPGKSLFEGCFKDNLGKLYIIVQYKSIYETEYHTSELRRKVWRHD